MEWCPLLPDLRVQFEVSLFLGPSDWAGNLKIHCKTAKAELKLQGTFNSDIIKE